MPTPVILSGARTPIGTLSGALGELAAPKLGSVAIKGALAKSGVKPESVGEVFMGNVLTGGVGQAPARQAADGPPRSGHALLLVPTCHRETEFLLADGRRELRDDLALEHDENAVGE